MGQRGARKGGGRRGRGGEHIRHWAVEKFLTVPLRVCIRVFCGQMETLGQLASWKMRGNNEIEQRKEQFFSHQFRND